METRDGRHIAVEFVSNVYRAGDRNVIQCNVRDITERKRAEEELRWKTAFLEAQVDSALDGILVVDNQGRKILQNQRMNELWKIPPHIAGDTDDAAQVQFVASQTKNPTGVCREGRLSVIPIPTRSAGMKLIWLMERSWTATRRPSGTRPGNITEESGRFATSPNTGNWSRNSGSRKRWRPSASWPPVWRMTSTTFWR